MNSWAKLSFLLFGEAVPEVTFPGQIPRQSFPPSFHKGNDVVKLC
jgi:hypothetical protein